MSATGDNAMMSSRRVYDMHCGGITRGDQSIPENIRSAFIQSVYLDGSLALKVVKSTVQIW